MSVWLHNCVGTNQGLFSAQVCSHEVNYAYISGAIQSAVITSIPLVVPMYVTACLIICFKPNSKASSHCKHKGVLFHMVKCEGICKMLRPWALFHETTVL